MVRGRQPRSAPVAACGYPIRARSEEHRLEDLSFEDRWLLTDDCCPECGAALGLESTPPPGSEPAEQKRNWALIGSLLAAIPMALALLARVIAAVLK